MKKVLTILASFALFSNSTITVVACSQSYKESPKDENFDKKNDLNNLIGAATSQAKAIILDNEYGISQSVSNLILNDLQAKDMIDGFNPTTNDGLNGLSNVGDVVKTYLANEGQNYQHLESQNVKLNHQKGLGSFFDQLIPDQYREQFSFIKNILFRFLNSRKDSMTAQKIINNFNQIYDDNIPQQLELLFAVLEQVNGKELITSAKPFAPIASAYFTGIFKKNSMVKEIRNLVNQLFNPNSETYLVKTLYENSTEQIPAIGNIAIKDVKKEMFYSINRILNLIYEIPKETNPDFIEISQNPNGQVSLNLASLILNSISNTTWKQKDLTSNLLSIIQEIMRIVTLLNAYFSFFDEIKIYEPQDDQHLFDAILNNYEYISKIAGGKTLGDSAYVKDKAINFNYLLANLDYYFGSIEAENDISAYRVQQGLFLLMNDPSDNYQENPNLTYENKTSAISDIFLDTLLLVGAKSTTDIIQKTILSIYNSPTQKKVISTIFFKPFVLGLFNGEDLTTMMTAINGLINFLVQRIPNLNFFKDYIDDIKNILSNLTRIYSENLLHHLLVDDLRSLFVGNKVINESLINRWFNKNQKVNLQTMITQPFTKILSLINPNLGLTPELGIGDLFLNETLPKLINTFNIAFNTIQPEFDAKYASYQNREELKSLKNLNLDLPNFLNLINQVIGDEQGNNNLFSNVIEALFSDPIGDNKIVERMGLNIKGVFEKLGMNGENSFSKNSFFGSLFKILLPLTKTNNGDNLVLTEQDYQIDLLNLWSKNFIEFLNWLDKPITYQNFLTQLINNDQIFNIKLKENEISYFAKNSTQIQHIAFYVEFSEPLTLIKTTYLFRLERQEIGQVFSFYQLTTNK